MTPEEAVNLADVALYKAKQTGRNRAIAIAEQSVDSLSTIATIEKDFEQALSSGLVHIETIDGPRNFSESQRVVTNLMSATKKAA